MTGAATGVHAQPEGSSVCGLALPLTICDLLLSTLGDAIVWSAVLDWDVTQVDLLLSNFWTDGWSFEDRGETSKSISFVTLELLF